MGKHKHKKSWAHNGHRNIALLSSNVGTTIQWSLKLTLATKWSTSCEWCLFLYTILFEVTRAFYKMCMHTKVLSVQELGRYILDVKEKLLRRPVVGEKKMCSVTKLLTIPLSMSSWRVSAMTPFFTSRLLSSNL